MSPLTNNRNMVVLSLLIDGAIEHEGGYGSQSHEDWRPFFDEMQKAWRDFIAAHRQELREGKRFKVGRPPLKREMFPPQFRFSRRDLPAWPNWEKELTAETAPASQPATQPAGSVRIVPDGPVAVEAVGQVLVRVRRDRLTAYGLASADVAEVLAAWSGEAADLDQLTFKTPAGRQVPLRDIAVLIPHERVDADLSNVGDSVKPYLTQDASPTNADGPAAKPDGAPFLLIPNRANRGWFVVPPDAKTETQPATDETTRPAGQR